MLLVIQTRDKQGLHLLIKGHSSKERVKEDDEAVHNYVV